MIEMNLVQVVGAKVGGDLDEIDEIEAEADWNFASGHPALINMEIPVLDADLQLWLDAGIRWWTSTFLQVAAQRMLLYLYLMIVSVVESVDMTTGIILIKNLPKFRRSKLLHHPRLRILHQVFQDRTQTPR